MRYFRGILLFLFFFFPVSVYALPAFPGAEGFGSSTIGGRGGTIIKVTNLNDSGPGSFRDAVENRSGPRIVIFSVSGLIQANSIIYIKNPFITVAGQTAPGDGIAIKGSPIFIRTHDVIIRGLRMRIGDGPGTNGTDRDGISVWGDATHLITNVIIDHNSIAWGVDENTSVWDETNNANTITFSWNIIAEGLFCSIHNDPNDTDRCHSMGMLINSPKGSISVHHNLFATNNDRNPAIQFGNVEVVNNVVYNWGLHPTTIRGGNMHALGNMYIKTAGTSMWKGPSGIRAEGSPGKLYLNGNIGPGGTDWDTMLSYPTSLENTVRSNTPVFTGSGITVTSAETALKEVLSSAGAMHDSVDTRIIHNVKNRTSPIPGKWIIDSQKEVGGWPEYSGTKPADADNDGIPDSFETAHGGDVSPSAYAPSGYTWIEEYINSFYPVGTKSADANGDDVVNGLDFVVWLNHYGQSVTGGATHGDFNSNGFVDGADYGIWLLNYGK